ncbi:MAG: hypothetical protein L6Q92_06200 [Phycisphaerae bacterium]|nr:hypothetical protein [Phycisphaerae bacterium]
MNPILRPNRFGWRRAARTAAMFALVTSCVAPVLAERRETTPSKSPSADRAHRAAIVPVRDEINDVTFTSMKRRFDDARARGATMVVLELDTPGGLVTSSLDICNYLKNVTDLRTIAWVHPHAFSAGSMIAVACDEIVMSSSSRIGDCAPIMLSPDGLEELGKTERAKAESPILKEFRDSAHRRGYDPLLSESMVRLGNEIYWIENTATRQRRFVRDTEKDAYLSGEAGGNAGEWQLVRKMKDPLSGRTLDVQQPVVQSNDLLTLTQTEALWFGFAKAIVSSEPELSEYLKLSAPFLRLEANWSELLAAWLSSPIVRSILFVLMLMGAYAEFHAPGHFVGGAVAVIALALFLGAPYITGLANVWEIVVVVIGVGLLCIELFLIPGFGVTGVLGLGLVLVGLVASFVQPELPIVPRDTSPVFDWHWPQMPATWHGVRVGITVVSTGLIVGTIGAYLLSRILPRSPLLRRIITPNPAPERVVPDDPYPYAAQPGDIGIAESLLRPAGKARFGPTLVDVVSESEYIPAGTRVQVIERHGNRVVVRRLRD